MTYDTGQMHETLGEFASETTSLQDKQSLINLEIKRLKAAHALHNNLSAMLDTIDAQAAEIARLREAAQAVIDRWHLPTWREAQPTAEAMDALAAALSALNLPARDAANVVRGLEIAAGIAEREKWPAVTVAGSERFGDQGPTWYNEALDDAAAAIRAMIEVKP